MAYVQSGPIEALDFNTLRNTALAVYSVGSGNSGYGQAVPAALSAPVVAAVNAVESDEWTALRDTIQICANHQGTASILNPPAAVLQVGDVITAHDGVTNADDLPQMATDITTNRLTAPALSMTTTVNAIPPDAYTGNWVNNGTSVIDFVWANENQARYFFNSGGAVRVRGSRTGGAVNLQNEAWTNLLAASDSISMRYTATTSLGTGTGSAIGYYDLTDTPVLIYSNTVGASGYVYYAANEFRVRARRLNFVGANGGNGSGVRLFVDYIDTYTGGSDLIDGTLRTSVDLWHATTHLTIATPTISVFTTLASNIT